MDAAHPGLALDRGVQGVLGEGVDRIDGALKVTGTARYGYEHRVEGKVAYGFLITAPAAKGRVESIETAAARALPGVIDVIVDDQRIPRQAAAFSPAHAGNEAVDHYDQVLGVAVAESFEAARAAARAVRVAVAVEQPQVITTDHLAEGKPPPKGSRTPDVAMGDIDAAMASAAATIDQVYATPNQVHAAMEPHATVAEWRDGKLTVHTSLQIL